MSANFKNRVLACVLLATVFVAVPRFAQAAVMTFPGLTAIRFTEVSGIGLPHFFLPASPQMTNQLGVLNVVNNDFTGAPTEVYDVFYSDANGALNVNGNYVTIEARFAGQAGGGLNIAAVDLLLGPAPFMICRADILASFVGLGSNYVPGSELLAVDPDGVIPSTFSVMGNTAGVTGRMRVTVGWTKIVPEPSSVGFAIIACAFVVCGRARRRC